VVYFVITDKSGCIACLANWRSTVACFILGICVSTILGILSYIVMDIFNQYSVLHPLAAVFFGIHGFYIWFSPVSFSSNMLVTQCFNTMTKLTQTWTETFDESYLDSSAQWVKSSSKKIIFKKTFLIFFSFLQKFLKFFQKIHMKSPKLFRIFFEFLEI
jgi:hypothetical protein